LMPASLIAASSFAGAHRQAHGCKLERVT